MKKDKNKKKNIYKNAIIIYNSGEKQIHDAVYVTKKGIYTGRIITATTELEEFDDQGFIPRDQIQKITVCNNHGKSRDIDIKK